MNLRVVVVFDLIPGCDTDRELIALAAHPDNSDEGIGVGGVNVVRDTDGLVLALDRCWIRRLTRDEARSTWEILERVHELGGSQNSGGAQA